MLRFKFSSFNGDMNLVDLPEECISAVVSFTSPKDACRISSVSKLLRSAADSDAVWERFVPAEYRLLINDQILSGFSNKQLFLRLCESPFLIDDGKTIFWLEKQTGKKCYMFSPRNLDITWVNNPQYWIWVSTTNSRFKEVAKLLCVCWFEIQGTINTSLLSKATPYGAYLVFRDEGVYGFETQPLEMTFGSTRSDQSCNESRVFLETGLESFRRDGWLEIEIGEYYVTAEVEDEEEEIKMSVLEMNSGGWKGGIVVQGIEIRPKISI